jgi:hypothetical protein
LNFCFFCFKTNERRRNALKGNPPLALPCGWRVLLCG